MSQLAVFPFLIHSQRPPDASLENMKDLPATFSHPHLPESTTYDDITFPLLVCPPPGKSELVTSPDAVIDYLLEHRAQIMSLLQKHAVLLFRGFAAEHTNPRHFADIVSRSLGLENFPYALGNAVRTSIVGDIVFTANESPPDKPIPFHHELAQTPKYPSKLLFYCGKPAETGGETPVLLSSAVYQQLQKEHPEFLSKVEQHGVIYSRVMTPHDRPESAIGRGWRATFSAETREQAEKALSAKGYTWQWLSDDADALLREISPILPAVVETNGRKAFFNQISAVWGGWKDEFNEPDKCIRAGDGTALHPDALDALSQIMDSHRIAVPWQRGDFVFIDNMQAQHSRSTFTGKRVVLASLAN